MKVSIIASAYRTQWWHEFLGSLKHTKLDYEVIFAGHAEDVSDFKNYAHFKHIKTDVKPAQCYEIARRAATGELIHWSCDDAVYSPQCLDVIYDYWKTQSPKTIISAQTIENGHKCVMSSHRFYASFTDHSSPLMAPLGFMSRQYLDDLGGIDNRFLYGQYENDIVMRVNADGGSVDLLNSQYVYIDIDHARKHEGSLEYGKQRMDYCFRRDRELLEYLWRDGEEYRKVRVDEVRQYDDKDILTKNQGTVCDQFP